MALFEPTEEEKAANSYLDWDDAALGKFAKYCALVMQENSKDAEGLHRVSAVSSVMCLVANALDANATELDLKVEGFTHAGVPSGDWHLILKRTDHVPSPTSLEPSP